MLRSVVANVYREGGAAREKLRLNQIAEYSPRVFWSLVHWLRSFLVSHDVVGHESHGHDSGRSGCAGHAAATGGGCSGQIALLETGSNQHGEQTGEDETACAVCGVDNEPSQILLCDGPNCDKEYHMRCLDPPLSAVPEGDFFGPCCAGASMASGVGCTSGQGTQFGVPRWHSALEKAMSLLLPDFDWAFLNSRERRLSRKAIRNKRTVSPSHRQKPTCGSGGNDITQSDVVDGHMGINVQLPGQEVLEAELGLNEKQQTKRLAAALGCLAADPQLRLGAPPAIPTACLAELPEAVELRTAAIERTLGIRTRLELAAMPHGDAIKLRNALRLAQKQEYEVGRRNSKETSSADVKSRTSSTTQVLCWTASDNQRPRDVAALVGCDPLALVELTQKLRDDRMAGLGEDSVLEAGTKLYLPPNSILPATAPVEVFSPTKSSSTNEHCKNAMTWQQISEDDAMTLIMEARRREVDRSMFYKSLGYTKVVSGDGVNGWQSVLPRCLWRARITNVLKLADCNVSAVLRGLPQAASQDQQQAHQALRTECEVHLKESIARAREVITANPWVATLV